MSTTEQAVPVIIIAPTSMTAPPDLTWPSRGLFDMLRALPEGRWFQVKHSQSDWWHSRAYCDRLVELGLAEHDRADGFKRSVKGHGIVTEAEALAAATARPASTKRRNTTRRHRNATLPPPTSQNFLVGKPSDARKRFVPVTVADRSSGDALRTQEEMRQHAAKLAIECTPRLADSSLISVLDAVTGDVLASYRVSGGQVCTDETTA